MSDLDNEELEATKKLCREIEKLAEKFIKKYAPKNDEIIEKEKSADELFEDLGYKKIENHQEKEPPKENEWTTQDNPYIKYLGEMDKNGVHYSMFIEFMTDCKKIQLGGCERGKNFQVFRNPILNLEDLKAINKKVLELGWLDE